MVKYRLSACGTSCNWPRVISPTPGRSTLITSAPNQASNCVQVGPDWTWVKSRMRTPFSALVIAKTPSRICYRLAERDEVEPAAARPGDLLLLQSTLWVEVADAAALGARRRID